MHLNEKGAYVLISIILNSLSHQSHFSMRVLINSISTKKHSGGAYQIAYNFISKTLGHPEIEWIYVISKDLDEILPDEVKSKQKYFVFPTQPDFKHTYRQVKKELRKLERKEKPDVVYSISSPSYFSFETKEVMRFTMPWVTHPNRFSWSVLSWKEKLEMHLYCWYQKHLIRKAKFFITQTETTRQGILRITGTDPENVKVVTNVLPSVFQLIDNSSLPNDGDLINIACVGNPSAHKNFDIIPSVLDELRVIGISNVRFHVTIPEDTPRWAQIQRKMSQLGLKDGIVNHGRISQVEMADMYRRCQLCFLPTLLEVFSASTVEAMYFHLPIVATDFEFNREVMNDACLYYEPKNARMAAACIKEYLDDESLRDAMKERMEQRLLLYGDYEKHFNEIESFLIYVASIH